MKWNCKKLRSDSQTTSRCITRASDTETKLPSCKQPGMQNARLAMAQAALFKLQTLQSLLTGDFGSSLSKLNSFFPILSFLNHTYIISERCYLMSSSHKHINFVKKLPGRLKMYLKQTRSLNKYSNWSANNARIPG